MLTIRYQRTGKRNRPFYRVVLIDSRKAPQGKAKEILGFYDPLKKEKSLKAERITYWISQGAQPSVTAHNMFVREHIIEAPKRKAHSVAKKEKAEGSAPETEATKKKEAPSGSKETETPAEGSIPKEESEGKGKKEASQA